jgi:hypothetical protein
MLDASLQLDPGPILQTAFAFWSSKVLLTAVEFGVFTQLGDRRMTGEELGAESCACTHAALPISSTRSWRCGFSTVRAMVRRRSTSTLVQARSISTAAVLAILAVFS